MRVIEKQAFNELVPVQIIGTQRSGSNLLRLMLSQLEGVFAPHPPHILRTFLPIISFYGNLDKSNNYKSLVNDICEFVRKNPVPWLNSELDPEVIIRHSNEQTLLEAYRKTYEINAIANNARYWFNKSMHNVYYIDHFEKNNLNPFYIHLVRDGRDVSLSFKKAIVGQKHIYHLASKWREDQEASNYYVNKFMPNRAIQVKYEDLLHQPKLEIQRICEFIGMDYSNNILKYYKSPDSKITAESGEMWHNLSRPLMKHNYNKYKKGLETEEIDVFEKVAGELMSSYGYHLENHINAEKHIFSKDEILEFDHINKQLKNEVLKKAVEKDLLKRYDQEQLIKKIHREKGIV